MNFIHIIGVTMIFPIPVKHPEEIRENETDKYRKQE